MAAAAWEKQGSHLSSGTTRFLAEGKGPDTTESTAGPLLRLHQHAVLKNAGVSQREVQGPILVIISEPWIP